MARAQPDPALAHRAFLLTGLSVYDDLAKIAGAGTLVPITGFANAVVSPAIEFKAEGFGVAGQGEQRLGEAAHPFRVGGKAIEEVVASRRVVLRPRLAGDVRGRRPLVGVLRH